MHALEVAIGIALSVLLAMSGAAKLLSPVPLATSLTVVLGQLRPNYLPHMGRLIGVVRAIAVVELVTAGLSCFTRSRVAGACLGVAVGVGVLVFVGTTRVRHIAVSCGCFGVSGERPVGAGNALGGVVLMAGYGLVALRAPTNPFSGSATLAAVTAVVLAACIVVNYARIGRALRPRMRAVQ